MMKQLLKLIRVHQWIKNSFVFLPIFFAGKIYNTVTNSFDYPMLGLAFLGFIMFSFTASSIYVLNDYLDVDKDRKHPEKKRRPLASGAISMNSGVVIFIVLLLISIAIVVFSSNIKAGLIVLCYFIMNVLYSFKLKHIPIVDITIISLGFLLRVLVGGCMTQIVISKWVVLLTFMLALILALGKRRGELINEGADSTRKALDGYNLSFIDQSLSISAAITIMCYIMFTLSPEVELKFHSLVYFTSILVIVGVLRYLQQTIVYNKTESPTKMAYKDRFLQTILLLWVLSFALLIYFKTFRF